MSNVDNISQESRDRFGRMTSSAIENNLSTDDASLAGTEKTFWMSLVRILSSTEAQYSVTSLSYMGNKIKFQNETF